MLRRLNNGFVVWRTEDGIEGSISPTLIAMFGSWRQNKPLCKEAGGLILGFLDRETNGLLAENLTAPGRGDKRTRASFFRSDRHQHEAMLWNAKTGGRGTQLGLWHTHPEADPSPSDVDKNDCCNVLRTGTFESRGLLYVIVGIRSVGCWYAQRGKALSLLGHFMHDTKLKN